MTGHEIISDNGAWTEVEPVLSVLIPFYRYDPCRLLEALDREAAGLSGQVEIIALDDGGGEADLVSKAAAAISHLVTAARLVALDANEGRSKGRNRLASHARARHLLFLDCDMAPDEPDFLARYLALIGAKDPAVVFGGFSMKQVPMGGRYALHRALSLRGECLPAVVRSQQPEKYVYTSNLLVRRDVFEAEAFDESFAGWGWEDVEWGMRVAARYGVTHIDNPATHLGLDTAEALARKYEQSAANFARVLARHAEVVAAYPSYRLARALKRLPALKAWRPLLKWTALSPAAPLTARVLALKTYRAALYAEVV